MLRLLNITLLFIWAAFLVWLLTYGKPDLVRLLHPRLYWILGTAALVLMIFLISLIIHRGQSEKKSLLSELPGILILLVPFLFFLIARDARLDGTSLQNRLIEDDGEFTITPLPSLSKSETSDTDDITFSDVIKDPRSYENKNVEIICQSFIDERLPDQTAMCYRYLITCCAADALPAFVFLKGESTSELENNRWIKVRGPLSVIRNNNMEFPSVTIDRREYVEEPAFPWAL